MYICFHEENMKEYKRGNTKKKVQYDVRNFAYAYTSATKHLKLIFIERKV